ncbi:MAG TPA: FAD-dependent oxidoreductase, partial [Gemmatimonadaceae bacterium]|nr:FAD-dependent oxidoreductase [Gemmatimonadaceae bacterium]
FSVKDEREGLEWNSTGLGGLFAQKRNLFSPSFHRLWRGILRFNREARELLSDDGTTTLGAWLERKRYPREVVDQFVIPMGGAVWSASVEQMLDFPAKYFVEFFDHHGFLQLTGAPKWRVVQGGSKRYVEPLIRPFRDRILTGVPVERVRRFADRVEITARGAGTRRFDAVVLAVHSDQALRMLGDPSRAEREILSCFPYQPNEAVLHTDERLLPRARRAWGAWNYHIPREGQPTVAVTYGMNLLQSLDAPVQFLVTLNRTADIDPAKVISRIDYAHPVYTRAGVAAQRRRQEISGVNRTFYAGAYWGYGFHEDGLRSGYEAAAAVADSRPLLEQAA